MRAARLLGAWSERNCAGFFGRGEGADDIEIRAPENTSSEHGLAGWIPRRFHRSKAKSSMPRVKRARPGSRRGAQAACRWRTGESGGQHQGRNGVHGGITSTKPWSGAEGSVAGGCWTVAAGRRMFPDM